MGGVQIRGGGTEVRIGAVQVTVGVMQARFDESHLYKVPLVAYERGLVVCKIGLVRLTCSRFPRWYMRKVWWYAS